MNRYRESLPRPDGTMQHPAPSPQPSTPLRGEVFPITFEEWQKARHGEAAAPIQKLFKKFGPYKVKPHRGSRGVIWKGRPFWWSAKGYYRPGKSMEARRPLQHFIWEAVNGPMSRKEEIWFKDRDRHNFELSNLECIHKSEVHRRTVANGEVPQITPEKRAELAGKRWTRHSRRNTALLLKSFNKKDSHDHRSQLSFLTKRKQTITHGPEKI